MLRQFRQPLARHEQPVTHGLFEAAMKCFRLLCNFLPRTNH